MRRMQEILLAIQEILHGGGRGALATVVETGGSAPQKPGSRLLLGPGGFQVGTVGGGAVEHRVIEELKTCLERGGEAYVLALELGELGMTCGGRMTVFIEAIEAPPRLVIFGAGHVGKPTAAMARGVGFSVTVVDEREELNTEARFPGCRRIVAPIEKALKTVSDGAGASDFPSAPWYLIVTHAHELDEQALDCCLRRPHSYIGLIGSRRKVFRILKNVASRGPLPSLERLYAPVGIDLGAESPEELALSIVSEMVALSRGGSAGHLRLMSSPLLERVLGGEMQVDEAVASMRG